MVRKGSSKKVRSRQVVRKHYKKNSRKNRMGKSHAKKGGASSSNDNINSKGDLYFNFEDPSIKPLQYILNNYLKRAYEIINSHKIKSLIKTVEKNENFKKVKSLVSRFSNLPIGQDGGANPNNSNKNNSSKLTETFEEIFKKCTPMIVMVSLLVFASNGLAFAYSMFANSKRNLQQSSAELAGAETDRLHALKNLSTADSEGLMLALQQESIKNNYDLGQLAIILLFVGFIVFILKNFALQMTELNMRPVERQITITGPAYDGPYIGHYLNSPPLRRRELEALT